MIFLPSNDLVSDIPVGMVYKTENYEKFKFIPGNREINSKHKKTLAESIKKYGLLAPIAVNRNYGIIDGQHRFECLKDAGLPVYFFIKEETPGSEEEINRLIEENRTSRNWKRMQYIISMAERGNADLKHVVSVAEQYKIPVTLALVCCSKELISDKYLIFGTTKENAHATDSIENYKVTVSEQDQKILLSDMSEFYPFVKSRINHPNNHCYALKIIFERDKENYKKALKAVYKNYLEMSLNASSLYKALVNISEAFNYGIPKKNNKDFSRLIKNLVKY